VVETLASLASHVEEDVVRTLLLRGGSVVLEVDFCFLGVKRREQSHQRKAPAPIVKVILPTLEREFHRLVASGGIVLARCRAWLRTRPDSIAL